MKRSTRSILDYVLNDGALAAEESALLKIAQDAEEEKKDEEPKKDEAKEVSGDVTADKLEEIAEALAEKAVEGEAPADAAVAAGGINASEEAKDPKDEKAVEDLKGATVIDVSGSDKEEDQEKAAAVAYLKGYKMAVNYVTEIIKSAQEKLAEIVAHNLPGGPDTGPEIDMVLPTLSEENPELAQQAISAAAGATSDTSHPKSIADEIEAAKEQLLAAQGAVVGDVIA